MTSPVLTPYQRQAFFWATVAFALGALLWLLSPVLTPFLLGAILAYILRPGVAWLESRRVPRGIAALSMVLLMTFAAAVFVVLVLYVVQKEVPQLQQQVPQFFARLQRALQPRLAALGIADRFDLSSLKDLVTRELEGSASSLASAAWTSVRAGGNVAITVIGNLVMVPLVLYYLLHDWHDMLSRVQSFVPRRWLPRTLELARDMDRMLSQYLRGQLLVMAVLAAYYALTLTLAGFEIALPVGAFTGLAVFIPYVGYCTGLALALCAALLQFGDWYGVGAVAAIYGVGQVLESFFLTPRLVGERIGLHPLAVIFALLAFGQLFGFVGVLLALPVSALMLIALRELRRSYLASALYRD